MDKIIKIVKNPYVRGALITGAIIAAKTVAFYLYKEMRKEGIAIDI